MKKFVFRLESCLKLRRHREEVEEIRLGELMGERQKLDTEQEELKRSLIKTQKEMTARTEMTSEEVNLYRNYTANLDRKIVDLAASLRKLEAHIDLQRSVLLKARQRRKVIDRLKEKRKERHQRRADHGLQLEMEELHLQRHGRE